MRRGISRPVGVACLFLMALGVWGWAPTHAAVIYSNNFEGAVGPEWSDPTTSITPTGSRSFLGQFHDTSVTLSLEGLPAHTAATVEFDLFLISTWDGNNVQSLGVPQGPDIWELNADGNSLVRTTFSNHNGFDGAVYVQSYPGDISFDASERTEIPNEDLVPWSRAGAGDTTLAKGPLGADGDHLPDTGASEVNTLGYIVAGTPMDSVYRMAVTFPHTTVDLQLDFALLGPGTAPDFDESWGLDNVQVSVDAAIVPALPDALIFEDDQAGWEAAVGGPDQVTVFGFDEPTENVHGIAVNDLAIDPSFSSRGVDFLPFTGTDVYPVILAGQNRQMNGGDPAFGDNLLANNSSPNPTPAAGGDLDGRAIKFNFNTEVLSVGTYVNDIDGGFLEVFDIDGFLLGRADLAPNSQGSFAGIVASRPIDLVAITNDFNSDINFGVYDLQFSSNGLLTAVPEPPILALLGVGFLGLSFLRRRSRLNPAAVRYLPGRIRSQRR